MFGIGAAYAGVIVYTKIVRRNFENERVIVDVKININGGEVTTKALIDTGSELIEPVSKRPVIVVEYDVLETLLPPDAAKLYDNANDFDCEALINIIENHLHTYKFCLIPFAALGNNRGIMLGIIPDKIEFLNREQPEISPVIGVCADKLSSDGEFFALTHATLNTFGGNSYA
jgi:stage II sporulation protein GA (sporulation sigma-E factor processing peptidase)